LSGREGVLSFLKENDGFLISTHVNPDGDALGSAIALQLALNELGKRSTVFVSGGVPAIYSFLPRTEIVIDRVDQDEASDLLLILLDCNSPARASLEGLAFARSAVIDHHETESDFGDARWVDPRVPATGMMVLEAIKALGVKISKEMAVNLYTAIAVDTGTFRYSNTNADTFRAAAELLDAGAEPGMISDSLYNTWNRNRFSLLCMNLSTIETRGAVSLSVVSDEMFKNSSTGHPDTESFVNYPLLMSDILVSACFRETGKDAWKVSLRSKGELNMAKVAERFGGGGHKNAAGYSFNGDLDTARQALLKSLGDLFNL